MKIINMIPDSKIKKLKELAEEEDIIDSEEIDELKDLRKKISDDIYLGILFLKTYTLLEVNYSKFRDETEDYSGDLKNYLKGFEVSNLRDLISQYNFDKDYGDSIIKINIQTLVNKNRDKYLELIIYFFRIFIGD